MLVYSEYSQLRREKRGKCVCVCGGGGDKGGVEVREGSGSVYLGIGCSLTLQ